VTPARDDVRRTVIRNHPTLNGLDALAVTDVGPAPQDRQRRLRLTFLKPAPALTPLQLRVDGGVRILGVRAVATQTAGNVLVVDVDRAGDFSRYTLRLVRGPGSDLPPDDIDPQLAALEFSFKVDCPGASDTIPADDRPPTTPVPDPEPTLDYLARDHAGMRRLMLDRIAALVPGLQDRDPADLHVTLVEALAHAADLLSYQQDAVAQEAYLDTARRRVSLRRHARLVDYRVHDGCNARTWLEIDVSQDILGTDDAPAVPRGTPCLTALPDGAPGQPPILTAELARLAAQRGAVVFETVAPVRSLHAAHRQIAIYTWKRPALCLPVGTTRATLTGPLPGLAVGDVLVFEQTRGPDSGLAADADPRLRAAVRLTSLRRTADPVDDTPVVEVAWSPADALAFELVVAAHGRGDLAVARGNIVLVDHGATGSPEPLGTVPAATLRRAAPGPAPDPCDEPVPDVLLPARFTPQLARGPLTFAAPVDPTAPASACLRADPRAAAPAILVFETGREDQPWRPRDTLLGAGPDARGFVAEVDDDGAATLRFGDDDDGARPPAGLALSARYRVGNGPAGTIGADALRSIVHADPAIVRVRNPLPADGAAPPESPAEVRQFAPSAFRRPDRAVTAADYAALAETHPRVQRAAAALRWTGSHHVALVTPDAIGGRGLDPALVADLTASLERARLSGHRVALTAPTYTPLELELLACVAPSALHREVRAALVRALTGLFDPDQLSFGQPVHCSRIVAAAQAVPGVTHSEVRVLRRLGRADAPLPPGGVLQIDPREIVRLDNDPNFAERGVLRLDVRGGR